MIKQNESSVERELLKTTSSLKCMDLEGPPLARDLLAKLEQRMQRTSNLLQELKALSKACEEVGADDKNKDKQVFVRRVVQLRTELQDAKDNLYSVVEHRLTPRQMSLLSFNEPIHDPTFDPSIRFFGIDWEQIFGKCFNVSISIKIFTQGFLDLPSDAPVDILLLNTILRDLSRLEMDITSHAEAVLNGRLSKSQQKLIQQEQARLQSIRPAAPSAKIQKAKSFRETSSSAKRVMSKYRKNKTSDFHRFSADLGVVPQPRSSIKSVDSSQSDEKIDLHDGEQIRLKRKSSFIQSFSNIFKNIR